MPKSPYELCVCIHAFLQRRNDLIMLRTFNHKNGFFSWVNFHAFCRLLIFFKINFSKISFRNTIRVSNCMDLDQARCFVGPDLGPNCLQRLSADNTSRYRDNAKKPLYNMYTCILVDKKGPHFITRTGFFKMSIMQASR